MRVPTSTYRVQLNGSFTFRDAAAVVPYLQELGVGDLYTSPCMKARAGSSHGYDVVDHNALNPDLGTPEDYDSLVETLHSRGMGHLLDWVPNHMGTGPENDWWMDVLENGPASPKARYFDIDWRPEGREALDGKALLPVLGDHYRRVLERGELTLHFDPESGAFTVAYYEHVFPLDPKTCHLVLDGVRTGGAEVRGLSREFAALPERSEESGGRAREAALLESRLSRLCVENPRVREEIEDRVREVNEETEDPEAEPEGYFEDLHRLLEAQAYRLAHWRVASEEINYRRFFAVNDLAGLRVEDEEVFDASHALLLGLIRTGKVDGLRLDHPDGLFDPDEYFERLQSAIARARGIPPEGRDPGMRDSIYRDPDRRFYVVIEKILAREESLPARWMVSGTTGYDFLNLLGGLFVDGSNGAVLGEIYAGFTGESGDFERLVRACKWEVMRGELASELDSLSRRLLRLAERDRSFDFTLRAVREALSGIVANFPVYRTYIEPPRGVSGTDRGRIERAMESARHRDPASDPAALDFIEGVLVEEEMSLPDTPEGESGERAMVRSFTGKFQQYTGPVMAKAVEDTAFYRYNRLVSLNEVGGEPGVFGTSVEEFHRANTERAGDWPHAMLSTSTHDTKRGEDVRARISSLSELPDEWGAALEAFADNSGASSSISKNDEYLLYQTLLGAWPLEEDFDNFDNFDSFDREEFSGRIKEYMLKALREAGERTSWTDPDEDYEVEVRSLAGSLVASGGPEPFQALRRRVARLGALNSLSQTLLKLTAPGVPDVYQGTELWDFSLVDPDNRRPVDYALRRGLLRRVGESDPRELLKSGEWQSGSPKLHLTWKTLQLRRERSDLFLRGEYVPLEVFGERSEHFVAFARVRKSVRERRAVIVVAPRLYSRLADDSESLTLDPSLLGDARVRLSGLPANAYRSVLTGEPVDAAGCVPLSSVLTDFPVALLASE